MSKSTKSMDSLDNLLLAFFGFSLVVPTIVQSFDLDTRLVWIPTIFYAFWILFQAYLKPSYFLSDFVERAIVERIRGWYYVFSLALTILGNYVLLIILPETISTYFTGVISISFALFIVFALLPRTLFRKEIIYMNEKQEVEIYKMLKEAGSASIFLSISVLSLSAEFLGSTEFSIQNAIVTLLVVFILFAYALFREKRSLRLASDLAISLINSRWYKKYSAKPKK